MTDSMMISCPKGCGASVHRENIGFHVCLSSNQIVELREIAKTIEAGGWHIAALKVSAAADEIERLTRELEIEKKTTELAYIPHRSLVESGARLQRQLNQRNEQIDGYERQLGIIDAGAERTIGSEIERLQSLEKVADALMRERSAVETTTPHLLDQFTAALKADPDLAWSWHCNIAMPIMDRVHCSHTAANEAAADLMRHLFHIDIKSNSCWAITVRPEEPSPVIADPTRWPMPPPPKTWMPAWLREFHCQCETSGDAAGKCVACQAADLIEKSPSNGGDKHGEG